MNRAINSVSKLAALVGSAFGLFLVVGCGDTTGLEKRYPVYGTVTYQGKPVEKGTINFIPSKPGEGRAAGAPIQNGSYSLTTASQGDGALPGAYDVTVSSKSIDTSAMEAVAKGGQFHHDATFAKANKEAKDLVPAKYGSITTSGLKAQVKTESNKYDYELKD
jgi:hypothetical protein